MPPGSAGQFPAPVPDGWPRAPDRADLAAGWPLAPQIVHAFGGSPGASAEAATYLRISLLGAPSMHVALAGTGVLRGLQDTRTPLTVAVAANVVNVALNAFLVLGLH